MGKKLILIFLCVLNDRLNHHFDTNNEFELQFN